MNQQIGVLFLASPPTPSPPELFSSVLQIETQTNTSSSQSCYVSTGKPEQQGRAHRRAGSNGDGRGGSRCWLQCRRWRPQVEAHSRSTPHTTLGTLPSPALPLASTQLVGVIPGPLHSPLGTSLPEACKAGRKLDKS